jgi:citrate synthase
VSSSFYTAEQAALRLGVSRQTLYSYVSRGLLRAHRTDNFRERRYLIAEVARLAARRAHGRSPRHAARNALNWGLPVIESSISSIDAGRLYYRGKDAVTLIDTQTVEDVAALLWQTPVADAFMPQAPACRAAGARGKGNGSTSLVASFAIAGRDLQAEPWQTIPGRAARSFGDIARVLAGCVLRTSPSAAPLHEQCARAWQLSTRQAKLIQAALILCVDHELNASSFTVRCVASTGASLHASVLGGLVALSGPRHGGMTSRVESLWDEVGGVGNPEARLRARLERGDDLPGFGHPLYPDGDVRAAALLDRIPGQRARWRSLPRAVEHLSGLRPSVDFALVALRRYLGLPAGSAFNLFALGRSIGWVAHAIEQRAQGTLIRPRASYIGPPPQGGIGGNNRV